MWYAVIGGWALLLSPFTGAETEAGETPSSLGSEKKKMEPALSGMDDRSSGKQTRCTLRRQASGVAWQFTCAAEVGVSQAGE